MLICMATIAWYAGMYDYDGMVCWYVWLLRLPPSATSGSKCTTVARRGTGPNVLWLHACFNSITLLGYNCVRVGRGVGIERHRRGRISTGCPAVQQLARFAQLRGRGLPSCACQQLLSAPATVAQLGCLVAQLIAQLDDFRR